MTTVTAKKATKKASSSKKSKFSKDTYLGWYEVMLRIRRFEEAALKAYSQQKIRGFLHVYIAVSYTHLTLPTICSV